MYQEYKECYDSRFLSLFQRCVGHRLAGVSTCSSRRPVSYWGAKPWSRQPSRRRIQQHRKEVKPGSRTLFLEKKNLFKNSSHSLRSIASLLATRRSTGKFWTAWYWELKLEISIYQVYKHCQCQLATPYIITKVHSIYSRLRKLKIGLFISLEVQVHWQRNAYRSIEKFTKFTAGSFEKWRIAFGPVLMILWHPIRLQLGLYVLVWDAVLIQIKHDSALSKQLRRNNQSEQKTYSTSFGELHWARRWFRRVSIFGHELTNVGVNERSNICMGMGTIIASLRGATAQQCCCLDALIWLNYKQ